MVMAAAPTSPVGASNAAAASAAAQKKAPAIPPLAFRKATIKKHSKLPTFAVTITGETYSKEIDSKGYFGILWLEFTGQETTAVGDPAASEDWPWIAIKSIDILDTNGGTIYHSDQGFHAQQMARYFGPRPRTVQASTSADIYAVAVSAVQANQLRFRLPIWIETNARDNLGLLPNQNASFKYTATVTFNTLAGVFTTPANVTINSLTLTPQYGYYTVPASMRADGRPQQSTPPFLGAVRQQTVFHKVIPSNAENRYDLTPGKLLRNLLLVTRTNVAAPGASRNNGITNVKLFYGDDVLLYDKTGQQVRSDAFDLFGEEPPTGVYPLLLDLDGDLPGYDYRRDYVDTRALSQIYMMVTTANNVTDLTICEDQLIVPQGMSL